MFGRALPGHGVAKAYSIDVGLPLLQPSAVRGDGKRESHDTLATLSRFWYRYRPAFGGVCRVACVGEGVAHVCIALTRVGVAGSDDLLCSGFLRT